VKGVAPYGGERQSLTRNDIYSYTASKPKPCFAVTTFKQTRSHLTERGGTKLDTDKAKQPGPSRCRLLSVIIPACNAAATLGEQLDALRAQEYDGDWEIIVVDNGSINDTAQVIQDRQRLMPHLCFVTAVAKQGSAYARNAGTQIARGDAFLFCDADDIVAPGWLSALAKALEKHDLVAGAVEMQTLNPSVRPRQPYAEVGAKYLAADFMPYAIGCNFAVSREAFEAVGGFAEDLLRGSDVDLSWRLQLRGYSIQDAPEAVVHYRLRDKLWPMWKMSVSLGKAQVQLYRRFSVHGMPRASRREVFQKYKRLIRKAPYLWRMERKARLQWAHRAGVCWGRLLGSLRHRTLYL
jgi:glycosyltransferase involved in cell wall biosynthesis